jgi:hypothetical protein
MKERVKENKREKQRGISWRKHYHDKSTTREERRGSWRAPEDNNRNLMTNGGDTAGRLRQGKYRNREIRRWNEEWRLASNEELVMRIIDQNIRI